MNLKQKEGMHWHPLVPQFISCVFQSLQGYTRIELPSRRTLNDYTHWVSAKAGFNHEVDVFLRQEAKMVELKYYNIKTGQRLHGFVNLGDMNEDLRKLEKAVNDESSPSNMIATHMLTLIVIGVYFSKLSSHMPISSHKVEQNMLCII